jgi:hypothetical protein
MASVSSFPTPGAVLWAVDVDLDRDVFRSGAANKPNVDFLRFRDLKINGQEGRVPDDQTEKLMIDPGQGISLFLERMIPAGLVLMDAAQWKEADSEKRKKIQWWGIDQKHPIPTGLLLIYDGEPPGHCTLSVTRQIAISSFLLLVAEVPFSKRQLDLLGPIH